MMKTRSALELLLRHEVPSLSATDAATLLDTKFRCLAAIQTYAEVDADVQIHTFYESKDETLAFYPSSNPNPNQVDADVLSDVELLFSEFPRGLAIAYLERVVGAEQSPPAKEDKFYSVLIDGTKRHRDGSLMKVGSTRSSSTV